MADTPQHAAMRNGMSADPTNAEKATPMTDSTALVTESVETLAEALGAMPEAYNTFDYTDEATTMIEAPVDQIAAALLASGAVRPAAEVRAEVAEQTTETAQRDKGLADYLAEMDRAGGGIYTSNFREGFRHALAMLAAYESDEEPSPDRVRPEVREAARLALSRRPAPLVEEGGHRG